MKDDWEIVVRIYVSMEKLAEAYRVAGLRTWDASFRDFVKGFNAERRLFECIDAGNDKEAADRKVQSTSPLFEWKPCNLTLILQRILNYFGTIDTARLLSLVFLEIEATPASSENTRSVKKTARGLFFFVDCLSRGTWN